MARSVNEWRDRLTGRLRELDTRLHDIDEELDSHNDPDWEDLALEREGDDVLERMGQSGETEIRMIRAALRRIEAGEFGICTQCGEEIAAQRLEAVPHTPYCQKCARRVSA